MMPSLTLPEDGAMTVRPSVLDYLPLTAHLTGQGNKGLRSTSRTGATLSA